MEKPKSVEAYFEALSDDARSSLRTLRETIAAAVPDAEEGIAWSMPAFKLEGKTLICYAAFRDHCSLFPMSGAVVDAHRDELGERVTGRGTIAFGYDERLPIALVKKIVRSRVAEVTARRG